MLTSARRMTRSGRAIAIATALVLLTVPFNTHAAGKGGGKPGGGGGGGGGDSQYIYRLTRLGVPQEADWIFPAGINNHGQVVGDTTYKVGKHGQPGPGFFWDAGAFTILPQLQPDAPAGVWAIADGGLIVGESYGPLLKLTGGYWMPSDPRAVWWVPNGTGFDVGDWNDTFPAEFFAETGLELRRAQAMSDDGRYVVFRTQTSRFTVIARLTANIQSAPIVEKWWVFEADREVGFADIHHDGSGTVRAVGYTDGVSFTWLKSADSDVFVASPVPTHGEVAIRASAINGRGELAGNGTFGDWAEAVFISGDLVPQLMGRLGSGTRSVVSAINDASVAVGWATTDSKDQIRHAFIWHPDTGMVDLNLITDRGSIELVDTGYPGSIINSAGQIVARGKEGNSSVFVLLTPVP
jgi:probable HAF family extracellular repeat protein